MKVTSANTSIDAFAWLFSQKIWYIYADREHKVKYCCNLWLMMYGMKRDHGFKHGPKILPSLFSL